jgi:putative transposase
MNCSLIKLGLAVSPRTIERYLRHARPPRAGRPSQRWATFVRNQATAVLACDFFVATVTASFRVLYVFVVLPRLARDGSSIGMSPIIRSPSGRSSRSA